jgi:Fe-S-cluster containining protein
MRVFVDAGYGVQLRARVCSTIQRRPMMRPSAPAGQRGMIRPVNRRPPKPRTRHAADAQRLARNSLLRADRDLLESVDGAIASAARRAGDQLVCRAGCSECCSGPFPINRLDAWRLAEGMTSLRQRDPARADAVHARARRMVAAFASTFPGDPVTGRLGGDETAEDRFFEEQSAVPCPVLDPATQTCELYEHRPLFCRTYGPPVTFCGENLPPCRLCFTTAPPKTIEACRAVPDRHGLERAILDRLKRDGGDDAETIIAYAIAAADEEL